MYTNTHYKSFFLQVESEEDVINEALELVRECLPLG